MLRPAPAAPTPVQDFEQLTDEAAATYFKYQRTRQYALDHGLTTKELNRYADGEMGDAERRELHSLLCRCPWALQYVTNRVKARRTED